MSGGKLTAEQVRGALLLHLPHREYYSIEQTDAWQAIADELNAALCGGECEMGVLDTGNEAAYEHYEYIMHCDGCHHEFGYVQYDEDGGTWQDEKPAFCPRCGKAVKR